MPVPVDGRPQPPVALLRGNRSFRTYWAGEAVSLAGSSLHAVALPVLAIEMLHASPGQVAVLAFLATLPAFFLALPAGVICDRHPKKTIMVVTDLAAAVMVAVVPVCWAIGALSVPVLYVMVLLLGALTVLHQAAAIAIVPELVDPALLPTANSRVSAALSVSNSAGAHAGTLVIAVAGSVATLLLDCLSYLLSAWCAARIRLAPNKRVPPAARRAMTAEIREGLAFVMRHPLLRPLVLALSVMGYGFGIISTYWAYYLLVRLDAGSTGLGLVMGAAGAGGLLGSVAASRLVRRFGPGRVIVAGFLAYPVTYMPVLVAGPGPVWLGVLVVCEAVQMTAVAAAGSTQRSVRQQVCPPHMQARAQQTSLWLNLGLRPFAALSAGAIAAVFGVWAVLAAGTALLFVPVVLLCSPAVRRRLTALPAAPASPLGQIEDRPPACRKREDRAR
ncbi:MFS transporter [Streptomyces lavenduligriseus]|uniref:MFS transporter n=1 Tax=Streptomyces lavenduligriseus TaxID=67315 RepID=A0ABT0P579_9ACTN|nr:MFS transporter [Streptomyces lavenduligriseus]MCL3998880.1 MFS transporter [Streptomyces lavenduligriseus]